MSRSSPTRRADLGYSQFESRLDGVAQSARGADVTDTAL
jgi:hypothetical protein